MYGLGFTGKDIGAHSIRYSMVMALYLAKRPVCKFILISRWCSDVFILYMRRQVQEFYVGVSDNITQQDQFYTIPGIPKEQRLNPRTNNIHSFASKISLNGLNTATAHVK